MLGNKQLVFGVIMCLVAVCYLALIPFQVSFEPILGAGGRDKISGAFFPTIAGVFFLVTSLALCCKILKTKVDRSDFTKKEMLYALLIVVTGYIYVYLVNKLGYIYPTIAVLAVLCFILRPKPSPRLYIFIVYPIITALVVYYVFSKLFYVALP